MVLDKIKFVYDKFIDVINVIILGIMTVLVVYQVFARFVLNSPSAISEALSQYLFVWMIMFGSAYVFGVREHLTIDLIRDKFNPTVEMIVEIASNICLAGFILLVCVYGGWRYTQGQAVQVAPPPAVLLFTPIFLPIVQPWGMSAVHFGLMMVMNLCVGTLTPPVGAILFAGCRTHGVKIEQIIKPLLPFFAVIFLILMMITYIPILSEFIPKMLGLM